MNTVITGSGIVSAIGLNKEETLRSLLERRSGIGEVSHLQTNHHELPVGEVHLSNAELKKLTGIPQERELSRTALLSIPALREAMQEAQIDDYAPCNERRVLVTGTTVGGMDLTEQHFHELQSETVPSFFRQHDCFGNTLSWVEECDDVVDIVVVSTACSSAANALMVGAEMIKKGEADIVYAGGSECLSRFHLNGFNSLMILDHERCRPFDAERQGLNLGEGAAFVVLESESHARQRGVEIQAYLSGYGNACDAFHQTASSEDGEGAYLAMFKALQMASLSPSDIQYVNAHGTGTSNNDASESAALKRVFGEQMPPVSSTKSFTGHTTSASGSIEAVICLLALQNQMIPANIGWQNPMPNGIIPSLGQQGVELNHILCNSFGFGGNDSALVLSRVNKSYSPNWNSEDNPPQNTHHLGITILADVEITDVEQLSDLKQYVKPLELRRMGKLMKASLLSSLKALEQAGLSSPDAIVTGTQWGCVENSEQLLLQMEEQGEEMLKPTLFMQSTHNTVSSNIAIRTKCHGYNITLSCGPETLDTAISEAKRLLHSGRYQTVLVGIHDESTPMLQDVYQKLGWPIPPTIYSRSILMSCIPSSS